MVRFKITFTTVAIFALLSLLAVVIVPSRKIEAINDLISVSFSLANYSLPIPPSERNEFHDIVKNLTETKIHPLQSNAVKPLRIFDCSVSWVRIPKTATTSIYKLFMGPLESSQAFATTKMNSNTCLTGPGGCEAFWNEEKSSNITSLGAQLIHAPPYGIEVTKKVAKPKNATSIQSLVSDRCFPLSGSMPCIEYNEKNGSMNYGPSSDHQKKGEKGDTKLMNLKLHINSNYHIVSGENIVFNIHPNMQDHVGLDVSLFSWLMPSKTMVFSAFRDPVERLISSFHYGIFYGANRPGQVKVCSLPKQKNWKATVASAKANNTEKYNNLMRNYLNSCANTVDNAYVSFLDPLTKNISVALNHLETYVIVGLTSDISGTLERWKNLTLQTCREHEKYQWIRRALAGAVENSSKRFNEGLVGHDDKGNDFSSANKSLHETGFSILDADLKDLVRKYTAGDEIIYRRALELYEEQRSWGQYYQYNE